MTSWKDLLLLAALTPLTAVAASPISAGMSDSNFAVTANTACKPFVFEFTRSGYAEIGYITEWETESPCGGSLFVSLSSQGAHFHILKGLMSEVVYDSRIGGRDTFIPKLDGSRYVLQVYKQDPNADGDYSLTVRYRTP